MRLRRPGLQCKPDHLATMNGPGRLCVFASLRETPMRFPETDFSPKRITQSRKDAKATTVGQLTG